MIFEPNNTITNASDSGVSSDGVTSATISSEIEVNTDVDIYQFQLNQGDGVTLDINASEFGSSLDPILRVFDGDGNELAVNDDSGSLDSFIAFIPNATDTYYVGVSSFANFDYDPINGSSDNGGSIGVYNLEFNILEVGPDDDPDNTIAEAVDSGVNGPGFAVINDTIDAGADADIYRFQLSQGDSVTLDINASQLGTGLDPILRLFDADGNELTVNDDAQDPSSGVFSLDSFIVFEADTTGDYYVGVSGFSNFDYDQINGRTNLDPDGQFFSSGDYELVINAFNTINGTDGSDILNGTAQQDLINGFGGNDFIYGRGQNDYIDAGDGNDFAYGNAGNDTIIGGNGIDNLYGDAGDDVIRGGNGADNLYGGAGADTFIFEVFGSNPGNDSVFDFEDGTDLISLGGASFFDADIDNSPFGVGATISVFGQTVVTLVNVDANLITEEDFA